MADNDRLRKLVTERHQLEQRLRDIEEEIALEVTGGKSQPSLHRLIVASLVEGEKKIGDVVRHVLENGYRHSEKNRDVASAVSTALTQLRTIEAVEMKADRTFCFIPCGGDYMGQIMDRLRERFRPVKERPEPPTTNPDGTPRRGRPPGSRTRRD